MSTVLVLLSIKWDTIRSSEVRTMLHAFFNKLSQALSRSWFACEVFGRVRPTSACIAYTRVTDCHYRTSWDTHQLCTVVAYHTTTVPCSLDIDKASWQCSM